MNRTRGLYKLSPAALRILHGFPCLGRGKKESVRECVLLRQYHFRTWFCPKKHTYNICNEEQYSNHLTRCLLKLSDVPVFSNFHIV